MHSKAKKGKMRGSPLWCAWIFAAVLCAWLVACTTSPLGRRQFKILPESELATMGVAAYDKMKAEMKVSADADKTRYVKCIANSLAAQSVPGRNPQSWEVTLFDEPSVNAFALPGGKIGVHTGLLEVATNQDQLAAVMGHEMAHVSAGHANERVSTQFATQTGLQLVEIMAGASTPGQQKLMAALGLGVQVGIVLPFSRVQEREADLIGLDVMAKVGFDPRQAIALWRNMAAAGGARPPELLSTHPANESRIRDLGARVPQALPLYLEARAQGRRPRCNRS